MSDFDYGNARIRAMKSRLLTRRELEALVESRTLAAFINGLAQTAYRKAVEAALARASGMECIAEALRIDLVNTLGRVASFYPERAREMVNIALRGYDLHNLKAILRGLDKNVPPGEILSALLPVGELKYATLVELSRAPGARGVVDMLASMNLPYARPLLRLRAEHPGAGVTEMELALEKWHYQQAFNRLKETNQSETALFVALQLEADIANVLTALRFAHAPGERRVVGGRMGVLDFERLFVGPGRLSFATLARAASQEKVAAAVEVLAGSPYEQSLRAGLEVYARSNRLSAFEKQLRKYRLHWLAALIIKDPLGIGVVLGYMSLKSNEISNLRWIANGINLGLKTEAIRTELEFAG